LREQCEQGLRKRDCIPGARAYNHLAPSGGRQTCMRKPPRPILILLSAALVGLACVPVSLICKQTARQSRRGHRGLSQRTRRAVRSHEQARGLQPGPCPQYGPPPRAADSAQPALSCVPALPLAPAALSEVPGEPGRGFLSRPRYLLLCRLLI